MDKAAILLITCDELNKGVLGYCGGQAVKTPQIDSLAKEGTNYGNCYTTSPWCLPARCSILTGLYPHHSGAYSNFRKCALDNGLPNLFTSMKEGGYHTSVFGKCHFAPVPYSSTRPDRTLPYDDPESVKFNPIKIPLISHFTRISAILKPQISSPIG